MITSIDVMLHLHHKRYELLMMSLAVMKKLCLLKHEIALFTERKRSFCGNYVYLPYGDRLPSGTFFFIIEPRSLKFGMRM